MDCDSLSLACISSTGRAAIACGSPLRSLTYRTAMFLTHPAGTTKTRPDGRFFVVVGEDGFEPSKSLTTDLQSAPFGHSGTLPYSVVRWVGGAGGRTRTPDLLITNQLLYQLSYTSIHGGSYRARTCDILLVRQTLSQLS